MSIHLEGACPVFFSLMAWGSVMADPPEGRESLGAISESTFCTKRLDLLLHGL